MANELGRTTVNDFEILELDDDPSTGIGYVAKQGALASFRNIAGIATLWYHFDDASPTNWKKVDLSDNDWSLAGNALVGSEKFGSTNNQDVNFIRNNTAIMSLLTSGVLIGLASGLGGKLDVGVSALGDALTVLSSPNGGAGAKVIRVTKQYKIQTTDDTTNVLATISIPDNSRVQIHAYIGGNQHGGIAGTIGDGADYQRIASFKKIGVADVVKNGRTTPFTEEDDDNFKSEIDANLQNIEITVRGNTDKNLAWSAHVEYSIFQD